MSGSSSVPSSFRPRCEILRSSNSSSLRFTQSGPASIGGIYHMPRALENKVLKRHHPAMRVIGGKAGGRILKVPKGLEVRPTPDLVKQAVFNSLGDRVLNARILELFGGSGALSLESLSRGAASA